MDDSENNKEIINDLAGVVRKSVESGVDLSERIKELERVQRSMRRALAVAHGGALLYRDDGELQDNSRRPFIDWKRDAWEIIKEKLRQRNESEMTKEDVKAEMSALHMLSIVDTFISSALKELGREEFMVLPEWRVQHLATIMFHIIKTKHM